jgi:large subunit ribosomal protein L21
MYAIIATGGKQYRVSEGDKVRVERLDAEVGSQVEFDQVLMVGGDSAKIGNPTVEGAKVTGEVTAQAKAKKVIVYKYKHKKGYHKKNGHRQYYTEVEIKSIVG